MEAKNAELEMQLKEAISNLADLHSKAEASASL